MSPKKGVSIQVIADLLKDKKPVPHGAGEAIVAERLALVGKKAPFGRGIINLAQVLVLRKGDAVPKAFLGIAGINLEAGVAADPYTDAWCQSNWNQGNWGGDSWGECWDNSTSMGFDQATLVINTEATGIKAFGVSEFTAQELGVLANFNMFR